jgi:hypothetical protein
MQLYQIASGAPGTIRTSDPQIRSLMLYPAELRAHFSRQKRAFVARIPSKQLRRTAKERFSYRLPPRLARSANGTSACSPIRARISAKAESFAISSRCRGHRGAMPRYDDGGDCRPLRSRPLVANTEQLDGAIRNHNAERRADRSLDQMDLAVMGTHQFGRDRKPQPAAAGPA